MACNNDYDELEEIIVGVADFSGIPELNIAYMKCCFPEHTEDYIKKYVGFFPQQIIDEQNEDLNVLADTLKELGVIDQTFSMQKQIQNHPTGMEKTGIITALEI